MDVKMITAEIDAEILRLTQIKQALSGITAKKEPGRLRSLAVAVAKPKKRKMSAAGRARIAAAQKARWAKLKKAAKPAVAKATAVKPKAAKAKKAVAKPVVAKPSAAE